MIILKKYCPYCLEPLTNGICKNGCVSSVPNDPRVLRPGTKLHNRYLVGRVLGQGGFGITYIGRDLTLETYVAIKEYFPTQLVIRDASVSLEVRATSQKMGEMLSQGYEKFLKEARILARFRGETGIVDVLDFFEENNTAYIVMEYIDGQTLRAYLDKEGKMPPNQVFSLMTPVMNSLDRLHQAGLIHRDISPDNIMLTVNGEIKLLDFGTVRNANIDGENTLTVMLKHGYAPEEQYDGKSMQGPWTDVYALCATMYKCITGTVPENALLRRKNDPVQPPSKLGVAIAPAQEAALMKGLACDSEDRFQSVRELAIALYTEKVDSPDETLLLVSEDRAEVLHEKRPASSPNTLKPSVLKLSPKTLAIGGGMLAVLVLVLVLTLPRSGELSTPDTSSTNMLPSPDALPDEQPSIEESDDEAPSNQLVEDTPYESGIDMSDDLLDFTVEIDGTVYQVPMSYSELLKAGWTMRESKYTSESDLLDPGKYASATIEKGEKHFDIGFINMSGNTRPLSECTVVGIQTFEAYNENQRFSAKLACGIEQYVSRYSDIFAILGEPDSTNGIEDDLSIVYNLTDDGKIQLFFDAEQILSAFVIKNEIAFPNDETTTNEAAPAFFKNYSAPVQLGKSPLENVVEWRGDLYTLPAPISAFEENGWAVVEYRIDPLSAKDHYRAALVLKRNDNEEVLNLYNVADYQTTAKNCVVPKLWGRMNSNAKILLSGGITCGSSFSDVEKLVGRENMSELDSEYRFILSDPDTGFSVEIVVNKNDNLVSLIEVTCLEWQFN